MISRTAASSAVESLLRWVCKHAKKQKKSQKPDATIHLFLSVTQITTTRPHLIPLPHPLLTRVCIVVADPSPKFPSLPFSDPITSKSLPVPKVLTFSSFKTEFKSQDARGGLLSSHDIFFIDSRIVHLLQKFVGEKYFKKKKRHLVVIDFGSKRWREKVESRRGSAFMCLGSDGSCQMSVGRVSMVKDEIVDNVVAAIEGVVHRMPDRWKHVRSFHLKSDESILLPVYQVAGETQLMVDGLKEEDGYNDNNVDDEEYGRKGGDECHREKRKDNKKMMEEHVALVKKRSNESMVEGSLLKLEEVKRRKLKP